MTTQTTPLGNRVFAAANTPVSLGLPCRPQTTLGLLTMLLNTNEPSQLMPCAEQALDPPTGEEALDVHTPPEIAAEVLIELMAHLRMQLHQLAAGATNEPSRQQFEEAEWAIYDMRLAFDPHDRHSVHAMRQRMLRYSGQVELGLAPTIGASGLPQ